MKKITFDLEKNPEALVGEIRGDFKGKDLLKLIEVIFVMSIKAIKDNSDSDLERCLAFGSFTMVVHELLEMIIDSVSEDSDDDVRYFTKEEFETIEKLERLLKKEV